MDDSPETNPLRELVFEYLERSEEIGASVLEELCSREPEHAAALRARVSILHGSGLASSAGADAGGAQPERLGAFRLLERIGGGGMGVVYRALDESLGREVALKLVRPSELFFPGARERFRREIEAVARLSHPGIVPVYSAGEEGGVPYFAMERVEGCTLGEALAAVVRSGRPASELAGADLEEVVAGLCGATGESEPSAFFAGSWGTVCARVVREVAEALEHAHRRGVLHRDVKPSNVMITPGGRVMLVDFGLSSAEGVDRITRTGSAMGSLPYMSPEQLDGDWKALDARTDVYALGVTLYEVLTLDLPFREASPARLRAAVLEGSADAVRRRNPRVSWELETITVTAMLPDRARRYASAAAMAADLSAALDGRPIAARRAGALRRAARWAARHPTGAALAALTGLVAVGGPALFGWQERRARLAIERKSQVIDVQRTELAGTNAELAVALEDLREAVTQAREQRDEARTQEGRAERNFERALAAVDTMLTRVADEKLRDVPGLHRLRGEILEDALAFYLDFLEERGPEPLLRREAARAWRRIGEIHALLDRPAQSEEAFVRGIDLLTPSSGEAPDDPQRMAEVAHMRELMALPLRQLGRHAEAEEQVLRAIAELERAAELDPSGREDFESRRRGVVIGRAEVLRERGRAEQAAAELEELLPELEAAHASAPDAPEVTGQLARAHHLLGVLLVESSPADAGERERVSRRSEEHHGRVIELLEPAVLEQPQDVALRRDLARSLMNLASAMLGRAGAAQAEPLLARSLELSGELCRDFPGVYSYAEDNATALLLLGAVRASLGHYEEGIAMVREAGDAMEELFRGQPHGAAALRKLASAQLQEATVAWLIGKDAQAALRAVDRALESHRSASALSPEMPQTEMGFVWCLNLRSDVLLALGNIEEACAAARAWSAMVAGPGRRASAALRLATCATAAEEAQDLPEERRQALADGLDAAAAEQLETALREGLAAREIRADTKFAPLLARPAACWPLELSRED